MRWQPVRTKERVLENITYYQSRVEIIEKQYMLRVLVDGWR
jgi:hypothetical protein